MRPIPDNKAQTILNVVLILLAAGVIFLLCKDAMMAHGCPPPPCPGYDGVWDPMHEGKGPIPACEDQNDKLPVNSDAEETESTESTVEVVM